MYNIIKCSQYLYEHIKKVDWIQNIDVDRIMMIE